MTQALTGLSTLTGLGFTTVSALETFDTLLGLPALQRLRMPGDPHKRKGVHDSVVTELAERRVAVSHG